MFPSLRRTDCLFIWLFGAVLIWCGWPSARTRAQAPSSAPTGSATPQELKFGETIEGVLEPGRTLRYAVNLKAGEFVHFEVIVRKEAPVRKMYEMGAQLVLFDPAGAVFYREFRFARQVADGWRQPLKRVAGMTGTYYLEVTPRAKQLSPAPFQLSIAELRPATEADRALETAESLYLRAARLWREEQKLEETLALGEESLALYQKWAPPDTIEVADLAILLADVYGVRFFYRDQSRQEELHEIAIQNREAIFGPVSFFVASLYSSYGTILDPVRAQKAFGRALEILIQTEGPESEYVPVMLTSVGDSYERMGDKERAFEFYERAIRLKEKLEGPEHNGFTELINLGSLQMERKNWQQAEAAYAHALRAIARWASQTGANPAVPNGIVLDGLTNLSHRQGDFRRSDEYQQQWLATLKSVYPPYHRGLAAPSRTKGRFLLQRGQHEAAAQEFTTAQQVLEQTGDSPELAEVLRDWRRLHLLTGHLDEAIAAQQRAVKISEEELKRLLVQGSEYQMLRMLTLYAAETNETLALHAQFAPQSRAALELAFTTLLQRKGRVLDEMNQTLSLLRNSADPDSAALEKLLDLYSQISAWQYRAAEMPNPAQQQAHLKQLIRETEALEASLSQRNVRFRAEVQPVTLTEVQKALPAGAALVEFARFSEMENQHGTLGADQYVAYILHADGTLGWTPLGQAAVIETAVQAWLKAFEQFSSGQRLVSVAEINRLARRVDALVMQPVREKLGGVRQVFLAPEGVLNLMPFAALVDERGRELVRDYQLDYLTSGRDLLRLRLKRQSREAVLVFAAPDYNDTRGVNPGADGGTHVPPPSVRKPPAQANSAVTDQRRGLRSVSAVGTFEALDNAEAEAESIKRVWPQAQLFLGKMALESALKRVSRPLILHVVTHGGFAPAARLSEAQGNISDLENPLLHSWLAFAGANQRKSGNEDGILTAYEAAALDLWGTKLVVLSACETGLGEIKNGEGVYGLRRALVLAGAETQVTSLWKVDDRVTRLLMSKYYAKLRAGVGRIEALRQVQLELLNSQGNRHPFYWAGFIGLGEWANLAGERQAALRDAPRGNGK